MKKIALLSALLLPLTLSAYYPAPRNVQREISLGDQYQVNGDRYVTDKDKDLLAAVRDKLNDGELANIGKKIEISVDHGAITLTLKGFFENEMEKQQVMDSIREIDGIKALKIQVGKETPTDQKSNVQGTSDKSFYKHPLSYNPFGKRDRSYLYLSENDPIQPAPMSPADELLKKKVKDKLINVWFGKKYDQIEIDVRNGSVTLKGNVATEKDAQEIEHRVKGISDVKVLNNLIHIGAQKATGMQK